MGCHLATHKAGIFLRFSVEIYPARTDDSWSAFGLFTRCCGLRRIARAYGHPARLAQVLRAFRVQRLATRFRLRQDRSNFHLVSTRLVERLLDTGSLEVVILFTYRGCMARRPTQSCLWRAHLHTLPARSFCCGHARALHCRFCCTKGEILRLLRPVCFCDARILGLLIDESSGAKSSPAALSLVSKYLSAIQRCVLIWIVWNYIFRLFSALTPAGMRLLIWFLI